MTLQNESIMLAMPKRYVSFLIMGCCLLPLGARADDLIAKEPSYTYNSKKEVIVDKSDSGGYGFWQLEKNGRIRKLGVPESEYRVVFTPDKNAAIKDRWRSVGVTLHLQSRNGRTGFEEEDLYNCFVDWTPPSGKLIEYRGLGAGFNPYHYNEFPEYRPTTDVPLKNHGAIPLRSIESIEIIGDAQNPTVIVTPAGRSGLPADSLRSETLSGQALDPIIVGYVYGHDGDLAARG